MLERLLAVGLTAVIAAVYGASAASDTYFLALVVPLSVGVILAEATYTTLLPRFTAADSTLLPPAVRVSAVLGGTLTIGYAGVVLAVWPTRVGVWLIFAPMILTFTVTGVYSAALVASGRYVLATLRVPAATALTLFLVATIGHATHSLVLLSSAITASQLAVVVVLAAANRGPRRGHGGPDIRDVFRGVAAVAAAGAVYGPVAVVAERALATTLPAGSISLLAFARGFALTPLLLPNAIANGIFPSTSERFGAADDIRVRSLVTTAMRLSVTAAAISTIFLVITRRDLVRIAIEHGALSAHDATQTARLLAVMSGVLVGHATLIVAVRALFAIERRRPVAIISAVGILVYVAAAVPLASYEHAVGLATAYVISGTVGGLTAAAFVARALSLKPAATMVGWLVRPLPMVVAFGSASISVHMALGAAKTIPGALAALAGTFIAGACAFAAISAVLRTEEYLLLRGWWRRRREGKDPRNRARGR